MSLFVLDSVRYDYPGAERPALDGIDLCIEAGMFFSVLGPNGSGKSTLLRVMLGELPRTSGAVLFRDRPSESWKRREVAKEIAFVPQAEPLAFPMTVRSLVEMGRYPHTGLLGRTDRGDRDAIDSAMERAGVTEFAHRSLRTLSGGERQRARIARALAQEPSILVLDEPTAALDLHFEMETFELLRDLADTGAFTVIVATHNLNLAARYSSMVLLLAEGHTQVIGRPGEVITADVIERVYRWPVLVTTQSGLGRHADAPQVLPLPAGDTPPRR